MSITLIAINRTDCIDRAENSPGVDAFASSLDEISQDVQTLWLVEGQEGTLRGDDVAGVNSFNQSLLQFLYSLDEIVLDGAKMKLFRTSGELETVRVTDMWLVRSIYVDVVSMVDGAESVGETVEFVVSQELLMQIVVERSLTDMCFLVLDALLLVLHWGLLLSLLKLE